MVAVGGCLILLGLRHLQLTGVVFDEAGDLLLQLRAHFADAFIATGELALRRGEGEC